MVFPAANTEHHLLSCLSKKKKKKERMKRKENQNSSSMHALTGGKTLFTSLHGYLLSQDVISLAIAFCYISLC